MDKLDMLKDFINRMKPNYTANAASKGIKLDEIPMCGNCEFFLKFPPKETKTKYLISDEDGLCRFYPKHEKKPIWHWCGQWKTKDKE